MATLKIKSNPIFTCGEAISDERRRSTSRLSNFDAGYHISGGGGPRNFGIMTIQYNFQFETRVPKQLMMILEKKDHIIPILGSTRGTKVFWLFYLFSFSFSFISHCSPLTFTLPPCPQTGRDVKSFMATALHDLLTCCCLAILAVAEQKKVTGCCLARLTDRLLLVRQDLTDCCYLGRHTDWLLLSETH